jgi:cell division septal protein FtsQ
LPKRKRRPIKGHVLPDERAERHRRRLRWRRILVTLAIVGAIAGAFFLYRSPLLRVQEVAVAGTVNIPPERIREVAAIQDDSMFNADFAGARERIAALALIKSVHTKREWPDRVSIEVVERVPWGYWDLAGTTYVVDGEGVVLADITPAEGAPVIKDIGAPTPPLAAGERVDGDAVRLAQALLTSVPEQLAIAIAAFEYRPESGLAVVTEAGYRVVMGDSQNMDYKLAVWRAVEEDIGRGAMKGHVLDLRFGDRPAFQ